MSDAWPFLVSRNRVRDYQPLVAPGFLIDKGNTGQLIGLPLGSGDGVGQRREAYLGKMPVGRIAVVYRAVEAKLNGEVLRDVAGRQIFRIEGVVLRDGKSAASVSEDILDQARQDVEPDFRSFWKTAERAKIRPSAPIPLPPRPEQQAPFSQTRTPLGASLIGTLVLLGLYHIWLGPNEEVIAELRAQVQTLSTQAAAVPMLEEKLAQLRQELTEQKAARESLATELANLDARTDALERAALD